MKVGSFLSCPDGFRIFLVDDFIMNFTVLPVLLILGKSSHVLDVF